MANLTERHEQLAEESKWDFSDLTALFINCTLVAIMEHNGVCTRPVRRPRRGAPPCAACTGGCRL
jgi:hypothetical protein